MPTPSPSPTPLPISAPPVDYDALLREGFLKGLGSTFQMLLHHWPYLLALFALLVAMAYVDAVTGRKERERRARRRAQGIRERERIEEDEKERIRAGRGQRGEGR